MNDQYTDPADFLAKLDWEGNDGITWFTSDEFEDGVLADAVDEALVYHKKFHQALNAAINRAIELGNTDA